MLLNDLYEIISIENGSGKYKADIRVNAAHGLFAGHFPGMPVLPGVVQLDIVREMMEQALGRKLSMKQMRTCKFLQIINPSEISHLTVEVTATEGEKMDAVVVIRDEHAVYLKAQLTYAFQSGTAQPEIV